MKTSFLWLVVALLGCPALAQDPPKPIAEKKIEQGKAKKQEPGKGAKGKQDPQPATGKPGAGKPANGKTGTGDPKAGDPKAGDPKAGDPKAGDPKTGQPETDQPEIDPPISDQPIPTGTDPADLAAIKSAEQMLDAERKLARMIKEGKITGLDSILPFDELSAWPYEDGLKGMPKRVKELDGKKVLMTGFMLPIDEVQNIKEFLLVQSLWSCCYGQPPDINGIVRCVMPKDKRTDYFFDPLKIIGTFKVEATVMDGYCVDIYQLHIESIEAIR